MNRLARHAAADLIAGAWFALIVYATAPAPENGGIRAAGSGAVLVMWTGLLIAGCVLVGTAITYSEPHGMAQRARTEVTRYLSALTAAIGLAAAGYALIQPLYSAGPPSSAARWAAASTALVMILLVAAQIGRNLSHRRRDVTSHLRKP